MSPTVTLACGTLLLAGVCASSAAVPPPEHPVVLGVNLAGSRLLTVDRILYWQHEPFYRALADLGVRHVDMQLWPVSHLGEQNSAQTAARVLEIVDEDGQFGGVPLLYCPPIIKARPLGGTL